MTGELTTIANPGTATAAGVVAGVPICHRDASNAVAGESGLSRSPRERSGVVAGQSRPVRVRAGYLDVNDDERADGFQPV